MTTTTSLLDKLNDNGVISDRAKGLVNDITKLLVIPLLGILGFLLLWSVAAQNIDTSLGKFPGPAVVWEQFGNLYDEHNAEREKEEAFYERQEKRNAARVAKDPRLCAKDSRLHR